MTLDEVRDRWHEVVEALTEVDEHAAAMAALARPTAMSDSDLVLTSPYPLHASLLQRQAEPLGQVLAELFDTSWRLHFESSRAGGADASDGDGPLSFIYPVDFTEDVAQRVEAEATHRGVNPIDLIRKLVTSALPDTP